MADGSQSDNKEFFALLSRELTTTFPATVPVRIDKDDWEMLHSIIDSFIAAIPAFVDDIPLEAEVVERFKKDLLGVTKLHKAVSTVCSRIANGEDIDVIVVPF